MTVLNLKQTTFDETITQHPMVLVDFWAEWCGPCRIFDEIYERVAEKYPDIIFAKVNIEEELQLAEEFNVRAIPFLMVFRNNVAVFSVTGALNPGALEELIDKAKALTPEEIETLTTSIQESADFNKED